MRILLILLAVVSNAVAAERPNILFLFADDQRYDTIAALGNQVIKTPNLDRLVRRGLSFERAYMQGGQNARCCCLGVAFFVSMKN
jgi:hypothetical protein